jgi:hypothetical protein
MIRNPMQAILQFAENRGQDAEILTNRLNSVFEPVANMLTPASATAPAPEPAASPFNIDFAMGPRRPNPPAPQVTDALGNLAASVLGEGATVRVTSGMGEYGSPRHRGGLAADVQFVDPQGNPVTLSDERARALALAAPQFGITGFGAGEEYMGDRTFHMDMFPPDQYSAGMGHTWGSFGQGVRGDFVSALGETDQVYRNVAGALDMSVSSSGSVAPEERRDVESMLGAILNEVADPATMAEDERRAKISDMWAAFGTGIGQIGRGDAVDLSDIRNRAERRRNQNIQLRMERAKRAAGASYAMELGDEGLARAIAGGAADINTLLTKRQQDMVEARALRSEAQQFATNDALISALEEGGMTISDAKRTAIMNGGPAVLDTLFTQQERTRALESLEAKLEIDEDVQTTYMAIADLVSEQAEQSGDPRQMMIAQIMRAARGTKSYAEAEAEAGSLFAPPDSESGFTLSPGQTRFDAQGNPIVEIPDRAAESSAGFTLSPGQTRFDAQGNPIAAAPTIAAGNPGEVAAAQIMLANPNATPIQREAAQIVVDTNGETGMTQAVASLTAGQDSADTERMERVATLTAAFEEQNVPPDRAQELAEGMVAGRFLVQPDPETGALTVYDKTALITGSKPEDAQLFPPVETQRDYSPPSILSSRIDYTVAFGPEGVIKNALNNLGEAVGLGLAYANNREAVQLVQRLATAGRIASAIEVGGRPSAYTLEMFKDLETAPAQLFTGPETALIRLQNQRDATVRELQTLDQLLAPGARVSATTRGEAYARRLALLPVLADLDVVIGGLRRTSNQQGATNTDGPSLDDLLDMYGGD